VPSGRTADTVAEEEAAEVVVEEEAAAQPVGRATERSFWLHEAHTRQGGGELPTRYTVKLYTYCCGMSESSAGGSSRVDLQACKLGTGRRFTTS
jgi:hypothetical protein